MPVPIPGLKVGSDNQKVKFLTIFGRPKTGIFRRFRGVPGGPNALDMDTMAARTQRSEPGCQGPNKTAWLVVSGVGKRGPHGNHPGDHPGENRLPPGNPRDFILRS